MTPGNRTMSKLPFLTAVPPIATKIFLLASMSREFICQCPMVTPISLGGKACAQAVPATRLNISDNAAISLVMAEPLLRREFTPNYHSGRAGESHARLQANVRHAMIKSAGSDE